MSKSGRIIALALCAAGFLIFIHSLLDAGGYPRRQKTQLELNRLQSQNEALHEDVRQLKIKVSAHRERPEVRARAIRDELNYVGRGDVVLDFRKP